MGLSGSPNQTWAVILAGGAGTRFWPLSRSERPKQLLDLGSGDSLLGSTVARFRRLVSAERIVVVTGANQVEQVRAAVPPLPAENVIAEPEGRDTLAAAALGAAEIQRRTGSDKEVMLLTPCDHAVSGRWAWRLAVRAAADFAAAHEVLVTIGLPPSRPESGYGYILPAASEGCPHGIAVHRVAAFVEKPPPARAARLAGGGWLWNSGVFAWQTGVFLEQVARRVRGGAAAVAALSRYGSSQLAEAYRRMPRQSVDRAVLERGAPAVVVQGGFGWEDLGNWGAVWRSGSADADGNVLSGRGLVVDGHRNLVWSAGDRLIVVAGMDDVLAVDTGDAVLILDRGRDQLVRAVPERLREQGWPQYL